MKDDKPMKTMTNITSPAFALFAFACFALSPAARATCQQGCLTNANTALGDSALIGNTSGLDDTATGYWALLSNTTGSFNTANGAHALQSNTTGFSNTAIGDSALVVNTTGFENTATGDSALWSNTGSDNTATGANALYFNASGINNTASGSYALFVNSTGSSNTANGSNALWNNFAGSNNTATGFNALLDNQDGSNNTATGVGALQNSSGDYNTADGQAALLTNTTGRNNTADGQNALARNTTGSNNIALGSNSGSVLTTGSNNIDIGNVGVAGESNAIRIGREPTQGATFIAGISGATVPTGVGVVVDANGHLGTITSSARFKEAIQPMDKASEAILSLHPVIFRYKKELDPKAIPQFGLVAEQVEKVDPDLVARDDRGKPYSVRYEAVNAMLLNEFLKEHRKMEEQGAMIARQQKQIEALNAGLQKVSAQLEVKTRAPEMVGNTP
jgi:hypothetical protein